MLGVNRAVGFGILTRFWSLAAGPITILMIATRLTREQQGFYYTFTSLLALQVFFELGLTTVIAQFASHEFAHLTWSGRGNIEGDPVSRGRLVELLTKSVKWFGVASVLMVLVLIPCGLAFLGQGLKAPATFVWAVPWGLAVLGVAANLVAVPFMAVIMGSGDVVAVNQRELLGALVGTCASWLVIALHGGLYAVCAVNAGNAIVSWGYILRRKPELVRIIFRETVRAKEKVTASGIGWWSEVWPMQWKIALSWASGYFIYQLFNPVLFYYHGAIAAGQMGITLSASNALLGASIAWLNTRSPEFGRFVAHRDWNGLDAAFKRVFCQALAFSACGGVLGWGAIALLQAVHPLGQRFIPAGQAAILLATVSIQAAISGLAIYLRAHKKEPFMVVSLIGAVLQGAGTWYLGMRFSTLGVTVGFFLVSVLFGLPSASLIWLRCRTAWHMSYEVETTGGER